MGIHKQDPLVTVLRLGEGDIIGEYRGSAIEFGYSTSPQKHVTGEPVPEGVTIDRNKPSIRIEFPSALSLDLFLVSLATIRCSQYPNVPLPQIDEQGTVDLTMSDEERDLNQVDPHVRCRGCLGLYRMMTQMVDTPTSGVLCHRCANLTYEFKEITQ